MKSEKYNKIKNIALVVLVICNLVCIWFLLGKPKWEEKRFGKEERDQWFIENILKKKIGLDDQQVAEFMRVKQAHEGSLHAQMRDMHALRKELFENMGNDNFDLHEQVAKTGQLQSELDSMAFAHFSQLRAVCRPEQYDAFDRGVRHIMLRGGEKRPAPPRKKME